MLSLGQGLNSSTGLITGVPTPITPNSFFALQRWYTQPSVVDKWIPATTPNTFNYRFNQDDANVQPSIVSGTPSAFNFGGAGDDHMMIMGEVGDNVGAIEIEEFEQNQDGDFTLYMMCDRGGLNIGDIIFGGIAEIANTNTRMGFNAFNNKFQASSWGDENANSEYVFDGTPFAAGSLIMLVVTRTSGVWAFATRTGSVGSYNMTSLNVQSSTSPNNKGKFTIGALASDSDDDGDKFFEGKIYEVIYYNRVLSAQDQEDLFAEYLNPRYASIT